MRKETVDKRAGEDRGAGGENFTLSPSSPHFSTQNSARAKP